MDHAGGHVKLISVQGSDFHGYLVRVISIMKLLGLEGKFVLERLSPPAPARSFWMASTKAKPCRGYIL